MKTAAITLLAFFVLSASTAAVAEVSSTQSIQTAAPSGEPMRFLLRQNGAEYPLQARTVEHSFVKSKASTSKEVIKFGGLSAGIYAGSGALAHLALAGAVGRQALGVAAGAIAAGVGMFGRKSPSQQGFVFDVLRDSHSSMLLKPGPVEIYLPVKLFEDGSYLTAEYAIVQTALSERDGFRVISSQKVKVRGGERPETTALAPREFEPVPITIDKTTDAIRITAPDLPSGDYAVVFRADEQILPKAFDFRIQ